MQVDDVLRAQTINRMGVLNLRNDDVVADFCPGQRLDVINSQRLVLLHMDVGDGRLVAQLIGLGSVYRIADEAAGDGAERFRQ